MKRIHCSLEQVDSIMRWVLSAESNGDSNFPFCFCWGQKNLEGGEHEADVYFPLYHGYEVSLPLGEVYEKVKATNIVVGALLFGKKIYYVLFDIDITVEQNEKHSRSIVPIGELVPHDEQEKIELDLRMLELYLQEFQAGFPANMRSAD